MFNPINTKKNFKIYRQVIRIIYIIIATNFPKYNYILSVRLHLRITTFLKKKKCTNMILQLIASEPFIHINFIFHTLIQIHNIKIFIFLFFPRYDWYNIQLSIFSILHTKKKNKLKIKYRIIKNLHKYNLHIIYCRHNQFQLLCLLFIKYDHQSENSQQSY
jgi:hypothetical protein